MTSATATPRLRDARPEDFDTLLALNAASVHFLSPLDAVKLARLHAGAAYHRVVDVAGTAAAFLLAFREGADYDSPNYQWFTRRYPRFLYIDRIVVDDAFRRAGFGRRLYEDIIGFARVGDIAPLTCEFDIEPPNPASERFHARMGFREVGTQTLPGGKRVSLQARD